MEGQNYLGIYLGKERATVVCLGLQGRDRSVLDCFSVSVEQSEEQKPQVLANLIAQGCLERELKFSEVGVALDCTMFMQHNLHSEFDDLKRISATIRFDTEEAIAADISDVAIAFNINSSDETGSELTVFTAQKKMLSEALGTLQSNNIDPVTMEPDVHCLSRFIRQNISSAGSEQGGTFFSFLSGHSGYLFVFSDSRQGGWGDVVRMRTFLLGLGRDRAELLAREVPVTIALAKTDEPINHLMVFDSSDSVNYLQLGERLGVKVERADLVEAAAAASEALVDCADMVDFAIAYGAALTSLEKAQTVNFRSDFSPYEGKKMRMQKTLKFLSISVTVLLLVFGVYFQKPLLQKSRERRMLREKLATQYSAVMLGKKPPARAKVIADKLGTELRRIKNVQSGKLGAKGEKTISAKLTLVLNAFNKCAKRTDLKIDSISITDKNISLQGSTSSRAKTLELLKALEQNGLESSRESIESKGGRDNFRIMIASK